MLERKILMLVAARNVSTCLFLNFSAMKFGASHPMGPLELCDYVGLDTLKSIIESIICFVYPLSE